MKKLIISFFLMNMWIIGAETLDFGGINRDIQNIKKATQVQDTIKNVKESISNTLGIQEYIKKYPNGITEVKGTLLNGKKVGIWYFYSEDGKVVEEHSMIALTGNFNIKIFGENGKKSAEGLVVNGAEQGEWRLYDEEEKLLNIVHYDKGVREGILKSYSKSGKLILVGLFKNNELVDARTINE